MVGGRCLNQYMVGGQWLVGGRWFCTTPFNDLVAVQFSCFQTKSFARCFGDVLSYIVYLVNRLIKSSIFVLYVCRGGGGGSEGWVCKCFISEMLFYTYLAEIKIPFGNKMFEVEVKVN